ncbi:MAG: hypothetical protein SF052_17055, partial [Bacteroidia bacterium]|nr:hypothetical protein [Bacteroidia bacterium]
MKNRLSLPIVSPPGILSVLLLSLHLSAFSQTQGSFTDDYSRPQVWEEVYQVPIYNGLLLPSSGDVHIE